MRESNARTLVNSQVQTSVENKLQLMGCPCDWCRWDWTSERATPHTSSWNL